MILHSVNDRFRLFIEKNSYTITCEKHGIQDGWVGCCHLCTQEKEEKAQQTQQIIKQEAKRRNSNVPALFCNASLDDFIVDSPKRQQQLDAYKKYNFRENLLFCGGVGLGKTYTACALIFEAIKRDLDAIYITFYQLTMLKFDDYHAFKNLANCDFLVIDEYAVNMTDKSSTVFYEIIDQRYARNLSTLISTNLDHNQLKNSMSESVYSRLQGSSYVRVFDGIDRRIK